MELLFGVVLYIPTWGDLQVQLLSPITLRLIDDCLQVIEVSALVQEDRNSQLEASLIIMSSSRSARMPFLRSLRHWSSCVEGRHNIDLPLCPNRMENHVEDVVFLDK